MKDTEEERIRQYNKANNRIDDGGRKVFLLFFRVSRQVFFVFFFFFTKFQKIPPKTKQKELRGVSNKAMKRK